MNKLCDKDKKVVVEWGMGSDGEFVFFVEDGFEQFGVFDFDLPDDRFYFRHDQFVALLQFGEPVGDVVLEQLLGQLLKLKRNQLDPLVLDVLDKVQSRA